MPQSPYSGKSVDEWPAITENLIKNHPLPEKDIVDAVLTAWDMIFKSAIGGLLIGKDLYPEPQIMSFLLHALIPHTLTSKRPDVFKIGNSKTQKDIHYIPNDAFSIEVKASSNPSGIYGNRSYAQQNTEKTLKNKDGFLLAVNFAKFEDGNEIMPVIGKIRFGFVEHTDWKGQTAETGQQASLSSNAKNFKLKTLYSIPPKKRNIKTQTT